MATLQVEDHDLVLALTAFEKAESIHGDLRIPAQAVTGVEVLDKVMDAIAGWRVGTGIPGSVAVGSFHQKNATTFAVVHHNHHRGVLVTLKNAPFDRLVIGCDDPEAVVTRLSAALGRDRPDNEQPSG